MPENFTRTSQDACVPYLPASNDRRRSLKLRHRIATFVAMSATATLCAVPQVGLAGWFGPSTYDECVLEKIKDASNPAAVIAVRESCRRMFPLKPINLPNEASRYVTAPRARFTNEGLEITVQNGNLDWTVESFKIMLAESPGVPGTAFWSEPAVGMNVDVFEFKGPIAPGGEMVGLVRADPRKAYRFFLVDLRGYR